MLVTSIFSFSHNLFYYTLKKIQFFAKFNLSSANAFSLDQSKKLSFGKELKKMGNTLWKESLTQLQESIDPYGSACAVLTKYSPHNARSSQCAVLKMHGPHNARSSQPDMGRNLCFFVIFRNSENPRAVLSHDGEIVRQDGFLILSRMTNLRVFQSQSLRTTIINLIKMEGSSTKRYKKHWGKRRNCSLRAITPFPTVF